MRRAWIGIALLAGSWLFALSYYHQANPFWWIVGVIAGTALLIGPVRRTPPAPVAMLSAALVLPAVWLLPWPYRLGPILMAAGLVLAALPSPVSWTKRIGAGVTLSGVVLLAQSVAMETYEALTARSHALPAALGRLLAATVELLGIDAAYDGGRLVIFSMRRIHPLSATWELLLDPVTVCFLAGAVVLIAVAVWDARGRRAGRTWAKSAGVIVLAVLLWLPLRAGLLVGLYLHRVLRTDYDASLLDLMDQFWNPWLHLALLAGPVLLAWRVLPAVAAPAAPAEPQAEGVATPGRTRGYVAAALALVAVALGTTALLWDPVGTPKAGRVLVDEFHSNAPWPSKTFDTVATNRRFDTEWYGHESAYNLYCLYDYASRFYTMSRTRGPLTAHDLAHVDVLVLKVPSARYSPAEAKAIHDFVDRGGGLLLIGEHTSVFGSGVALNDIARRYGFEFRYDCLFGVDSDFEQHYRAPIVPHPIIQRMDEMDFAISCSIKPLGGLGTAAIRATGLKSRSANYFATNFYPSAEEDRLTEYRSFNDPSMLYGSFVQAWATRKGAGRVVAFTDSTIFANFSAFEPGKTELFMGMLEWLNHRGGWTGGRWVLAILAVLVAVAAVALACISRPRPMLMVAAGVLGWSAAVVGVRAAGDAAMPMPKQLRPMVRVGIDRTVSDAPLPRNGFIAGKDGHFGQFERSILRLGYFTFRDDGEKLTDADAIVVLNPSMPVGPAYRDRLADYVFKGGHLLVLDGPENSESTAGGLVAPFGLEIGRAPISAGPLTVPAGWPGISVPSARTVKGGMPLATLNGEPVAAVSRHGKGTVTVIGFSSRFTDAKMGVIGDVIPDEKLRPVFDFEYTLIHAIAHERLLHMLLPDTKQPGAGNQEPGAKEAADLPPSGGV